MIKQLTIFLENKIGELTDITELLSSNGLSIVSINLADSNDFGLLRIIVEDEEKAKEVIDKAGFSVKIIEVIAIEIEDHIGSFNQVVSVLSQNQINIEYTYTVSNHNKPAFIFKVNQKSFSKAVACLQENHITLLNTL
ncbi:MAG: amino acid-binding protein [Candidatus Marinarcus sp.]|uniref:amino acid-binding protein n=1 Tax=Candidatus Marinarcus sp. TaxID=3100987 RepID=UPI003B006B93